MMTNEKAIEILELNYPYERCKQLREAVDVAIKTLQTQQKQAACDFCHEDRDGYIKPIEKNCHAFISYGFNGWVLSLRGGGWNGECKIRYCPMCGRELKEGGEG